MKKRALGQNFLIDADIAHRIVQAARITDADTVLEIGPGKGILTELLIERAARVIAIEVDPKLCTQLKKRFGAKDNFTLLEDDAVKFDYSKLGTGIKVVSNLPYYAATHIVKRLIHYHAHIRDLTVMLQKEVVDRFTAAPAQKEYGSLSVFIQYHCDTERLLEVPKTAFSPQPKIASSVVKLTPLARPKVAVQDEKNFFKVVSAAFLHKRKMLKNNLKLWQNRFETQNGKTQLAGIDLSRRGETLSLSDFARISNHLQEPHD